MKTKTRLFTKEFWVKQNFFKELNLIEHIVVWTSLAVTIAIFVYDLTIKYFQPYPYLAFLASILNIFSVAALIKRKPLFPLLGMIASIVIVPVCWHEHTYAMMFMYEINVITLLISFITWTKNSDKTASVKPRTVKWWQSLIYCLILAALIGLFTWVEGLQSYQDWMAPEQTPKPVAIPPWYFRMFDSASLMISVGMLVPLALRLKNIFPLYIAGNAVQIATWIIKLSAKPGDIHAWMLLINVFVFLAFNILGIINWRKSENK